MNVLVDNINKIIKNITGFLGYFSVLTMSETEFHSLRANREYLRWLKKASVNREEPRLPPGWGWYGEIHPGCQIVRWKNWYGVYLSAPIKVQIVGDTLGDVFSFYLSSDRPKSFRLAAAHLLLPYYDENIPGEYSEKLAILLGGLPRVLPSSIQKPYL